MKRIRFGQVNLSALNIARALGILIALAILVAFFPGQAGGGPDADTQQQRQAGQQEFSRLVSAINTACNQADYGEVKHLGQFSLDRVNKIRFNGGDGILRADILGQWFEEETTCPYISFCKNTPLERCNAEQLNAGEQLHIELFMASASNAKIKAQTGQYTESEIPTQQAAYEPPTYGSGEDNNDNNEDSGTGSGGGASGSDVSGYGTIGGGSAFVQEAGTTYSQSTADAVASSKRDLMDLDSIASSGDVVFVPGSTSFTLSDDETITVPGAVTLASNRGDGGDGALIEKPSSADAPAIMVEQNGKLTGFRVHGDDAGTHPNDRDTGGVGVDGGEGAEIVNNDISGFAKRCVIASGNDVHVHHNTITYCNEFGYGYGVSVSSQNVLIEYNRIDYYRHATVGYAGDSYVARFNVIGPHRVNHDIDMHADGDSCGSHCGGETGTLTLHHNTITSVEETSESSQPVVNMRGVSPDTTQVCSNWFYNTNRDNPVWQMDDRSGSYENMEVANNHQGEDDPGCSTGAPREACPQIQANGPGC